MRDRGPGGSAAACRRSAGPAAARTPRSRRRRARGRTRTRCSSACRSAAPWRCRRSRCVAARSPASATLTLRSVSSCRVAVAVDPHQPGLGLAVLVGARARSPCVSSPGRWCSRTGSAAAARGGAGPASVTWKTDDDLGEERAGARGTARCRRPAGSRRRASASAAPSRAAGRRRRCGPSATVRPAAAVARAPAATGTPAGGLAAAVSSTWVDSAHRRSSSPAFRAAAGRSCAARPGRPRARSPRRCPAAPRAAASISAPVRAGRADQEDVAEPLLVRPVGLDQRSSVRRRRRRRRPARAATRPPRGRRRRAARRSAGGRRAPAATSAQVSAPQRGVGRRAARPGRGTAGRRPPPAPSAGDGAAGQQLLLRLVGRQPVEPLHPHPLVGQSSTRDRSESVPRHYRRVTRRGGRRGRSPRPRRHTGRQPPRGYAGRGGRPRRPRRARRSRPSAPGRDDRVPAPPAVPAHRQRRGGRARGDPLDGGGGHARHVHQQDDGGRRVGGGQRGEAHPQRRTHAGLPGRVVDRRSHRPRSASARTRSAAAPTTTSTGSQPAGTQGADRPLDEQPALVPHERLGPPVPAAAPGSQHRARQYFLM